MKPIILAMLLAQAGIIAATIIAIAGRAPTPGRPAPVWQILVIAIAIVAGASAGIADKHDAAAASEVLQFGAGILIGLALCCALMAIREWRWGTVK